MADVAAVDASPLIFLSRAGLLELLRVEALDVVVPDPVWQEVMAKGRADPAAQAISAAGWVRRVEPAPVSDSIRAWDLGPGESSVLAWAVARPRTVVVMDDLEGRRSALALGLDVVGTLGLVLRGSLRGLVADPRETLQQLRAAGMWLSDDVVERALRTLAEHRE